MYIYVFTLRSTTKSIFRIPTRHCGKKAGEGEEEGEGRRRPEGREKGEHEEGGRGLQECRTER